MRKLWIACLSISRDCWRERSSLLPSRPHPPAPSSWPELTSAGGRTGACGLALSQFELATRSPTRLPSTRGRALQLTVTDNNDEIVATLVPFDSTLHDKRSVSFQQVCAWTGPENCSRSATWSGWYRPSGHWTVCEQHATEHFVPSALRLARRQG